MDDYFLPPFQPVDGANYKNDYCAVVDELNYFANTGDTDGLFDRVRDLCRSDLFFLLYFPLGIKSINHPWLVERIKDVDAKCDRTIDLWAREHFKSTIITYGLTIKEFLRDSEERIAIFSHTRGIAKSFLRRIKLTFEQNDALKTFFPDVCYQRPETESPKWSEDEGLILKRNGVYLEASLEAWGLVDGMPTSRHFTTIVYDDVVTVESVSTYEQLAKVSERFKVSRNLAARPGGKTRIIGTRYHFSDLYGELIDGGAWEVRLHPAEDENKTPVLMEREELDEKFKDMGSYVYACQMLQNPIATDLQVFKKHWIKWFRALPSPLNLYIICDPASKKKEQASKNDFTVMWVVGVDSLRNYYLVDGLRDKLNLTARWKALKELVLKHPKVLKIGYEEYGMQGDIEHFKSRMSEEGVYFEIVPLGGKVKKEDRIRRLVPLFEGGHFYLPEVLPYNDRNIVDEFVKEEYLRFPFATHDDMMDCLARIVEPDLEVYPPTAFPTSADGYQNVVSFGWAKRKRSSRFANY